MDSKDLRDFAARCLRVANVCVDGELAERLKATARDYLRLAQQSEQAGATDGAEEPTAAVPLSVKPMVKSTRAVSPAGYQAYEGSMNPLRSGGRTP